MDKIVIIVADLGHFKAYRVTREARESPRVQLIESYDSVEGHGKLVDKFSDMAGRFGRGGGHDEAAMDSGERHTIELEIEKRLVRMIAEDIESVIIREECKKWYLAANGEINRQIVEHLKHEVREKLEKNVAADLTKIEKSEILSHFT